MLLRLFIFLLSLTVAILAPAKSTGDLDLNFLGYTTSSGLPTNRVRDIVQDDEGYIWLACDGGLVRFDGVSFSTFLPADKGNQHTRDIYMMSLCNVGDILYVGSASGLYRFNSYSEQLEPLVGVEGHEVRKILADKNGDLWVTTLEAGVFRLDKEGNVKSHYSFPELRDYMAHIYCDRDNNIWGISNSGSGGVYRYDRRNDRFTKYPLTYQGNELPIGGLSLTEDRNGDYWVGDWNEGLIRFNPVSGVITSINEGNGRLRHIHTLTPYGARHLAAGTERGLVLVDVASGEYTVFEKNEINPQYLTDQFVYPVMEDREGGLWAGTFYGGVNYAPPQTKKITSWRHSRFVNSVSGSIISSLEEDNNGHIWIGSDDGGVCRWDPENREFHYYELLRGKRHVRNVHALSQIGTEMWVGTYSGGVFAIDINTGKIRNIPLVGRNDDFNSYVIFQDRAGNVWMGSDNELCRYDNDKNGFVKVRNLGSWIVDISEDSRQRLWIATEGSGVFMHQEDGKVWQNFTAADGLPHNHVSQVTVATGDSIYAATVDGVAVYDDAAQRFEGSSERWHGLRMVESVSKIGNEFWVAASGGLHRISPEGMDVFGMRDGLPSEQFSPGASLVTSGGILYLGTVDGFCTVRTSEMARNPYVPPVVLTSLEIMNNEAHIGEGGLERSLNHLDKLKIDHSQNSFSIGFSALSYVNPGENRYRYKLEGFDKEWIDAGHSRKATYSNLRPGNYRFVVQGSNNDGVWNDEGASIEIKVEAPWYARWWMISFYIILLVCVVYLFMRYSRLKREKEHKDELERVVNNQEKAMYKSKLDFFTMVAHEIRTPVSLILGPLEKISGSQTASGIREDIDMMGRNARRLLALVNQMLDFRKVEGNAFMPKFRRVGISKVVNGVADRFRPSMDHRGVTLVVDTPPENVEADIDEEMFTKLISNLINNAFKFTSDKVEVSCNVDDGHLTLSVSDNGIGMKKEELDKVFTPFYQVASGNDSKGGTGLGLTIVKRVAQAHGGDVEVTSHPGKGSVFTVRVPVSHREAVQDMENDSLSAENNLIYEKIDNGEAEKHKVLVVDDNDEMLSFLSSGLKDKYSVVCASNGRDALEIIRKEMVSLILCDWMMPVMDGISLLREVRGDSSMSHLPFIMLTAKTDLYSKVESMKEGADAYVEKPFSMEFLRARIESLIDIRRMLRDKYVSNPLEPVATLASRPQEDEFLERMIQIVEENLTNPELGVEFLALQLGLSRTSLYSKIRTIADMTPNEIIQVTRLKTAARLLKEGNLRVTEVSEMVGFKSPSYFAKCFQAQFGMKPNDFASQK